MKTTILYNNPFSWFGSFPNYLFEPHLIETTNERIIENDDSYRIDYSIPGMRRKDLRLNIRNNFLVIEGNRRKAMGKLFHNDRATLESSFLKSFSLSEDMDTEHLKAKFRNGILTIQIPKRKKFAKYREIPVDGENINETSQNSKVTNNWRRKIGEKLCSAFKIT